MGKQPNNPSRYIEAQKEWDLRIGSAKLQARNWRLACITSLVITLLLLIAIVMLMAKQHNYVYVAEVGPSESITNVVSMDKPYTPTQAQVESFIGTFIHKIMSLPLDPVMVRNQWLQAYGLTQGPAVEQLNAYARVHPPFADLGSATKTVNIQSFHPVGDHSYEFAWSQTQYNMSGKITAVKNYTGIFTIATGFTPETTQDILNNPLGIKIAYLNINSQGS